MINAEILSSPFETTGVSLSTLLFGFDSEGFWWFVIFGVFAVEWKKIYGLTLF